MDKDTLIRRPARNVGHWHRKDMDDLTFLAESLREEGLLQISTEGKDRPGKTLKVLS